MSPERASVCIVGCGPTGAVLANLLGAHGVSVIVLEREADVFPVPRATHLDHDTLRALGTTGLLSSILPHTSPFGDVAVADGDGTVLIRAAVGQREVSGALVASSFFDQPMLERVLRDGLRRFPKVQLWTDHAVRAVHARADHVEVVAIRSDGPRTVHADWVIGCDGGHSVVREAMGVGWEVLAAPRRWAVVDTELRDGVEASALPDGFRYTLRPDRLHLYAHGHGAHRRWEVALGDHEPVPSREQVLAWLADDIDPALTQVRRVTNYTHRAQVAETWRRGRLLLAGDAAHLMPPFAGQGLCAGVRDALGLAWRLADVLAGRASEDALDAWERERRAHVVEITRGAVFLGRQLEARGRIQRWLRRERLRFAGAIPWVREQLRARGTRRPRLTGEGFLSGSPLAGLPLPAAAIAGVSLDRGLDHRGLMVARHPSSDDLAWAHRRGVVVRLGSADPYVADWLDRLGVDEVLARPDRVVVGSGPAGTLPDLRARYDGRIRALDAAASHQRPRASPPQAP